MKKDNRELYALPIAFAEDGEFKKVATGRNKDYTYTISFKTKRYFPKTATSISREIITLTKNGKTRTLSTTITQRWWSRDEIIALAKDVGFSHLSMFGDGLKPFEEKSKRMLFVLHTT